MDRYDGPPDPELVQRYRECYGTGPDAARFLREVADQWEPTGRRPYAEDRGPRWGAGEHYEPGGCCEALL